MLTLFISTLAHIKIITPFKIKRASQPPMDLWGPTGGVGPPGWESLIYCLLTVSNVCIDFSVACHFDAFELAFN